MAKVYLSSSLLDLREERQVVTDWLIAAGLQPVHSYVADSETVRDSCLNDIDDCDFYVLIVGHRYGFQPAQKNPKKRSITHLEFLKAGKQKLPRLVFLRTSVPDINLSDLNDAERSHLVRDFRNEVSAAVRPAEFADKAGFVSAFSAAILQHVQRQLSERDALVQSHVQRNVELERELESARSQALSRVLDEAESPGADDLSLRARTALLKGDTEVAEALLLQQEEIAAAAASDKQHEAAELARQIAALALGRDSQAAMAALERAAKYDPEEVWTHIQLGDIQAVLGLSSDAMNSYITARKLSENLAARDPANIEWQRDLSVSHNKIGDVLVAQGDGPGALAAYRKGLAIRESLAARDPANTESQRDLSVSHDRIGNVLVAQGDGARALAAFRKSLAIRENLAARDPANTEWQRDLSVSHNKIGNVLVAQGDGPGALAAYRKGLAIGIGLAARDPANAEWQRDLIVSHVKLGEASGDLEYTRRALDIVRTMRDKNILAPRDAWMVEELEKRVREGTP